MRLAILAANPVQAASTRYRILQYVDQLEAAGIECHFHPFISADLYPILYRRGHWPQTLMGLGRSLLRTGATAASLRHADIVWVEREAAAIGPPLLEWLVHVLGRPLILDLDDALYAPRVSPVYGRLLNLIKFYGKTDHLIRWANHVVVGNPTLAAYVRTIAPNTPTTLVPTAVDMAHFRPRPPSQPASPTPIVGWIGSHSTAEFLLPLLPILRQLHAQYPFKLKIIGAPPLPQAAGLPLEQLDWQLEREAADFQSLDIGLYPLPNTEVARGKSGFKAIQYMAVGIPCVASPIGITADIVQHGRTGYLATTPADWVKYLGRLLASPDLRTEFGLEARRHALAHYDKQFHGQRLITLIRRVATGKSHAA